MYICAYIYHNARAHRAKDLLLWLCVTWCCVCAKKTPLSFLPPPQAPHKDSLVCVCVCLCVCMCVCMCVCCVCICVFCVQVFVCLCIVCIQLYARVVAHNTRYVHVERLCPCYKYI